MLKSCLPVHMNILPDELWYCDVAIQDIRQLLLVARTILGTSDRLLQILGINILELQHWKIKNWLPKKLKSFPSLRK